MRVLAIAAVLGLIPSLAAAQAPADQRFRLASSTLRLGPGDAGGALTVTVVATLQPDDLKSGGVATLQDDTASTTGVRVTAEPVTPTRDLQQIWRFAVTVSGFPRADSQSRAFVLSFGTLHEVLAYTLTNTVTQTFAWSVKAAPEWNLGSMPALSIPIRIGEIAATKPVLQQAAFASDDRLKRTLDTSQFVLCENATGACRPPATSLAPRTAYTYYVRPVGPVPAGVYKGNLLIASTEKTDPEVLGVTLYSSDKVARSYGLAALGIGVLVSLVLQVFARTLAQRRLDQAAIALLKKRLEELVKEFHGLPDDLQTAAMQWSTRADQLLTDMKELDDLVRSAIPQPAGEEMASIETLKAALERHSKTVVLLRTLLRDGLQAVEALVRQHHAEGTTEEADAAAAIAAISAAEDPAERIAASLATLRQALGATARATLASEPKSPGAEFRALRLQMAATSLLVWFAWAAISVLTGAVILIYQNPGFGTELDLLICLTWGLGIAAAGQQASSQIGPGTIAQSIGVKLPGAK